MARKLNKYSSRITEPPSQGASQAMLHATGLTRADLKKPEVGISAVWYEGNSCNMHLNDLAAFVKRGKPADAKRLVREAAGELGGTRRAQAQQELDAHRRARDELRSRVVALGAEPVDAALAYVEPFPVDDPAGGRRLMAHVNAALAATYADVAAASEPAARREAAAWSSEAAVRAVGWGAEAQAFPGT